MPKLRILSIVFMLMFVFGIMSATWAQSGPFMYFCEKYDKGETGISDRFTTGYITVIVICKHALGLTDVTIQFDKYNIKTGNFEYYKDFPYTISPDMDFIYFEGNDLSFDEPGIYRVFLLNEKRKTVTSALIEIVSK